jgi:hypothetical protein
MAKAKVKPKPKMILTRSGKLVPADQRKRRDGSVEVKDEAMIRTLQKGMR